MTKAHLTGYRILQENIDLLKEELGSSEVEALVETLQNLAHGKKAQIVDGLPSPQSVEKLNEGYQSISDYLKTPQDWRLAIQLAYFHACKKDHIQANHMMTPEAVSLIVALLVKELVADQPSIHLLDLAVGGGNLLVTVTEYLEQTHQVVADGVENDDLLVALAENMVELTGQPVKLHHQDSLQNLLIDPVDFVVSDLPIGYYPIDQVAEHYQLKRSEEKSYTHELMVEQSLKWLKEDGFGLFLLPTHILNDENTKNMIAFLNKEAHIQAILTLPVSFFKDSHQQKSILIVQKRGDKAKQADPVLIGEIPDVKNSDKLLHFLAKFKQWHQNMI